MLERKARVWNTTRLRSLRLTQTWPLPCGTCKLRLAARADDGIDDSYASIMSLRFRHSLGNTVHKVLRLRQICMSAYVVLLRGHRAFAWE